MNQMIVWLKKHIKVCILLQLIVLGVLTVWSLNKERTTIDAPLDTWDSEFAEFNGTTWYMDEGKLGELWGQTSVTMLSGPHMQLPRGSYTITVTYAGTGTNYCRSVSNFEMNTSMGLKADDITLEPDETVKGFRIEATEGLGDFELQIIYGGTGTLEIQNITICENRVQDVRGVVCLFLCFLALDIVILAGNRIKENRMVLTALLAIACTASLPGMIEDFYYGHDIWFHLLRIEGITQELRLGNFPTRIHSLCMEGYGYPMSIYYGDIFLYIPALFRLVGFSVISAYKIYIFIMNVATTCVSYLCFKKIFKERSVALVGALVYVTSAYRLADIYVRAAVGEYTAMLAFPIVALAIYRIYEANADDWTHYRRNALILALGMSVLIGSHILSTEMVVFVLALICIALYKKTFRKNTIKVYLLAVAETILLNAYFLIPFLDYWMNVDVNITDKMQSTAVKIQNYGVYFGQYFTFFESVGGVGASTVIDRMQMTPGLLLMAALVAAIALFLVGHRNKRWSFYVVFSVLILWLASNVFPWDYLSEHMAFFNLLAQVQFPWRYIGIAGIFLTLLLCELLIWIKESRKEDYQKWCMGIVVCAVLLTSYATGDIYDGVGVSDRMDTYDVAAVDTWGIGGAEYLRTGTMKNELSGNIVWENLRSIELQRQEGTEIEFYCEADGKEAYIVVPLMNYKGYHVRDDAGNEYGIIDGENNEVAFTLPADFAGNIVVSFEEPVLWRMAELVSVVTAMWLLTLHIQEKRRAKKA